MNGVKRAGETIREEALYRPVADFLAARGYTVRGEVRDWDISAVRGDELVAVELKRSITLALLEQAVQRQKAADAVYVAVPRPPARIYPNSRAWRRHSHLLRRLELGLILVAVEAEGAFRSTLPAVEVVFHPIPLDRRRSRKERRAVIRELDGRTADHNVGGSRGRKIVTAYRENALFIACCLAAGGPGSPKALRAMGTGPKTGSILYDNHYGWFERISRGLYAVKPKVFADMKRYPELVRACRERAEAACRSEGTT